MKILLHCCCAPCSVECIRALREEGHELVLYWYNPNIHPYTEYKARRDALEAYAVKQGLEFICEDDYGLKDFVRAVADNIDLRCGKCYAMRMKKTAERAAKAGFDAFSTTLLISPYQNHELIKATCERESLNAGSVFYYKDFRPFFRIGQSAARAEGMYMQKYCGCIFSEEDRYLPKRKETV